MRHPKGLYDYAGGERQGRIEVDGGGEIVVSRV